MHVVYARQYECKKYQYLCGIKTLKEDCSAQLLSRASFLKFKRGEFGKMVQPYLMRHRHNQ